MSKIAIHTDAAPKAPEGILSQAIVAGGFVFCAGSIPMDAETGKLIPGNIQTQTVRRLVAVPNKQNFHS
jgi:enamine deaminase RidA (YjgF/YER057c/UK114 family)